MPTNNTQNIEWSASEYTHRDHDTDWFWWLGALVLFGMIGSFLARNTLFAFFILIAGITIMLYAVRKPRIVSCKLTERGIEVGEEKHAYKNLKCFWFREEEGKKNLLVETEKVLAPHIIIEVPREEETRVRARLLEYIPEEERPEPLSHLLIEFFKF